MYKHVRTESNGGRDVDEDGCNDAGDDDSGDCG